MDMTQKPKALLAALLLPLLMAASLLSTRVHYQINDAGFLDTSTGLARHPFLSGAIGAPLSPPAFPNQTLSAYYRLTARSGTVPVELVTIPAGEFLMGSDADDRPETSPERLVYLDAYAIYQTPVTNAHFSAFVYQTGYQTLAEQQGWSFIGVDLEQHRGAYWAAPKGLGSSLLGRSDHPVFHVSWLDASAYCAWAGGALPTEAQWEKAARGTDGRTFPWGNDDVSAERANFCDVNCPAAWANTGLDDGYATLAPVGSFPAGASPYGVLDMAGNINEWVADWRGEDYYADAPNVNPTGPDVGDFKMERGGSWYSGWTNLRAFSRSNYETSDHSHDMEGFRCVIPISQP